MGEIRYQVVVFALNGLFLRSFSLSQDASKIVNAKQTKSSLEKSVVFFIVKF